MSVWQCEQVTIYHRMHTIVLDVKFKINFLVNVKVNLGGHERLFMKTKKGKLDGSQFF